GMSVGTDLILDTADLDTAFAPGRFFANKLWNIGRFVLGHLDHGAPSLSGIDRQALTLADRWILSRAHETIVETTGHYERFRFNEAAMTVYRFLWSDLPTGMSSRSSRACTERSPAATSRARSQRTHSTSACGCSTQSCPSSPKRCGSGCRIIQPMRRS